MIRFQWSGDATVPDGQVTLTQGDQELVISFGDFATAFKFSQMIEAAEKQSYDLGKQHMRYTVLSALES